MKVDPYKAAAELCNRSFFEFVRTFWHVVVPEDPVYNWHIEYICGELQKTVERVVNRLPKEHDTVINIPPGSTKSTIVSIMLPAWAWVKDPKLRIMTSSYSGTLAMDHSNKSRDIIKSKLYQKLFPKIKIRGDVDGKTQYKNNKGGERYAAGVGGSILGFHAHILIVDDPVTPGVSVSDKERQNANRFMDHTLSNRKVNQANTPTILVMQRLHTKDPAGTWLKKKKNIRHICLPAELSDKVRPREVAEYYVDGLLDPVRLTKAVLEDKREDMGSYGYAGQFGQSPAPLDGGIWKKWIIPVEDDKIPKRLMYHGTDWDLAYTKEQKNSASAYVTAGRVGGDMYITDLGFQWLEFPELMRWMKNKRAPHYIEAKASGKSAKQSLKAQGITAIEVQVPGGQDKVAKATMVTPFAESGAIYCRASLLDVLYNDERQGILVFPNGNNDDLADALAQSITRLLGKGKTKMRGSDVY